MSPPTAAGLQLMLLLALGLANFAFGAAVETPPDAPTPLESIARTGEDPDTDDGLSSYVAFGEGELSVPSARPIASSTGGWSLSRSRFNPQLLDGLRAALAVESDLQGEQMHLRADEDTREPGFDASERILPKRAPTGFTGMRGRRIPSGFNGVRGKKSLSLFGWDNQAARSSGPNSYRDGKRAPSGFLGMRGKKSFEVTPDERWNLEDLEDDRQVKEYPSFLVLDPAFGPAMHYNGAPPKRVPNGFMGLRG
ncbi:tachykinins-like [Anopheles nili]|uniref:tachykinins-like n=1 Tax=Anopheles nili TaxID=185578 RepID=UPI00237B3314|nr:tachykinins-like [Anopheles nili]